MGFILSLRYRTPRSNSLRVNAILLYDETFLYKKTMVFFYIRKEGIMPVAWRNNWETEFGLNLGKNWYRMNFMKIPVIEEFCFFKKILVFCNFGERRFSNRIYTNIWIHADGPIARWSISISNIRIAFVFFCGIRTPCSRDWFDEASQPVASLKKGAGSIQRWCNERSYTINLWNYRSEQCGEVSGLFRDP